MQITFRPAPSDMLPRNTVVSIAEGDGEVLYLINRDEPIDRICDALSTLTTDYASESWLHVGSIDAPDLQRS